MQEDGYLKNRDDADKFNLAMDDENIDFNISGNVHDLIQKIESHPQKEAILNDLEQHRPFNPFSAESKVAIMAAGNTELCEIINAEPKLQCKACLKHCSAGIIYCTCGRLMTTDSAENRKYISFRAGFVLHPELLHKEGLATRSQVWESTWMQRVPYGQINFKRNAARRNMTASTTDSSATKPSGRR